jgi:hypothetical protein
VVQDGQHQLLQGLRSQSAEIGPAGAPRARLVLPKPGHFLRLEVERGTPAHHTCYHRLPKAGDTILFQGVVLIDRDGPFYEVHPLNCGSREFRLIEGSSDSVLDVDTSAR